MSSFDKLRTGFEERSDEKSLIGPLAKELLGDFSLILRSK